MQMKKIKKKKPANKLKRKLLAKEI